MAITVTKELRFCCAHRLWEYNGPCFNIHGHNYRVLLTFGADTLNAEAMVIDFTKIKRQAQAFLDAKYDHSLVLHAGDVLASLLGAMSLNLKLVLCEANPTAEMFARDIFEEVDSRMLRDSGVELIACTVYETETSYATFSADI